MNHFKLRIRSLLTLALVLVISLSGCGWKPRMLHPYTYSTGKVLDKGKTEVSVYAPYGAGGSVAHGIAPGLEVRLAGGVEGDDIYGGQISFIKSLTRRETVFSSASIGYDLYSADEHDFSGYRFILGYTMSLYSRGGGVSLHLPLKLSYVDYDWPDGAPNHLTSGAGVVFVPGIGVSAQSDHVALRIAFNAPTRRYIEDMELYPAGGFQIALKF